VSLNGAIVLDGTGRRGQNDKKILKKKIEGLIAFEMLHENVLLVIIFFFNFL
jgi:hypothetical protein